MSNIIKRQVKELEMVNKGIIKNKTNIILLLEITNLNQQITENKVNEHTAQHLLINHTENLTQNQKEILENTIKELQKNRFYLQEKKRQIIMQIKDIKFMVF